MVSAKISRSLSRKVTHYMGDPYDANYYIGRTTGQLNPAGYSDIRETGAKIAKNIADDIETFRSVDGLKIVEGGCGFGYLTKELTDRGADVTGVDISDYAITQAKALFPAIASKFVVQDATVENSPDNVFDAVILIGLLDCMPSVAKAYAMIQEIKRVVKNSGVGYVLVEKVNAHYFVRAEADWQTDFENTFPSKTFQITNVMNRPLGADLRIVIY